MIRIISAAGTCRIGLLVVGILAFPVRSAASPAETLSTASRYEGDTRFHAWSKTPGVLTEGYDKTLAEAISAARRLLSEGKLQRSGNAIAFMQELAERPGGEDSFYVVDVARIAERYRQWNRLLGGVVPFYAVKTNPDPVIVQALSVLGTGFDCASEDEIRQVLATGASPERIIFAHPRKSVSGIEYARKMGVRMMTFDSTDELEKMLAHYPDGEYVLRIKTDDSHSVTPLSTKFGATMEMAGELLRLAHERKANVIGVAFHVGSNCTDPESYRKAMLDAAVLFKEAEEKYGMKFRLLDLGGGWPGTDDGLFQRMARLVNEVVKERFSPSVAVIAEPGRFMAARVVHIATRIIGADAIEDNSRKGEKQFSYYLSDGVYGSFLDSLYYHYDTALVKSEGLDLRPLNGPSPVASQKLYRTTLWGPTCDSGDKVFENIMLPEMKRGEYLYSADVGAYFTATRTSFNGIKPSQPYYFYSDEYARAP